MNNNHEYTFLSIVYVWQITMVDFQREPILDKNYNSILRAGIGAFLIRKNAKSIKIRKIFLYPYLHLFAK